MSNGNIKFLFLFLFISINGIKLYCNDNLYFDSEEIVSNEISKLCVNMTNENFHLFFIDNITFESNNKTEYLEFSLNLFNNIIKNSTKNDYGVFIFNKGQKLTLINEEEIENDDKQKINLNIYIDEILYQIRNDNILIALKLSIFRFNKGKGILNTEDFYIKTINNNPNKGVNITTDTTYKRYFDSYLDFFKICFEFVFPIVVIIFCFYFYKRRQNENYTPEPAINLIDNDDIVSSINNLLIKIEDLFKEIENNKNQKIENELCFICMKSIKSFKNKKQYIEMTNIENNEMNLEKKNFDLINDLTTFSCGHSFHLLCLRSYNIDFCILCYNKDNPNDSNQLLNINAKGYIQEKQLKNFVQNLDLIYDKKDLLDTYKKYPEICHTLNSCLLITLPNSWKYSKTLISKHLNINNNNNKNSNSIINNTKDNNKNNNNNNNNTHDNDNDNNTNNNNNNNNFNINTNDNNNNDNNYNNNINDNNNSNNNNIINNSSFLNRNSLNDNKQINSKTTDNIENTSYKPPKMINYDIDSKSNLTYKRIEMLENPLNLTEKDENKEISLNIKEFNLNTNNNAPPIQKETKVFDNLDNNP